MDTTQAIDCDLEDTTDVVEEGTVQVGSLGVSYPDGQSELHHLHTGLNIVGRRASQRQKDNERLERWQGEYSGGVSGVFLDSNLISSPHAIIYVENGGKLCFVKDMNSKNKTFLERGSSLLRLQGGDRYSINSGDTIRFGNVRCQVDVTQGQTEGEAAQGPSTGAAEQAETQAYMSFGEAMVEGGQGGAGEGAAAGGEEAAAGEEATGSRGAPAEQAPMLEPTQVEMQPPPPVPAAAAAISPPATRGGPLAAGPPSRSPTAPSRSPTRSRTTGDPNQGGLDYDEGDSIWLPSLTGAPASQQEVMSPPKEDALPVRLAANTGAPAAGPGLPQQLPLEPIQESPQTALQAATQLAEPSLGEGTAAQPVVGGYPAGGGAEAGPGSFSLRPAVAASAEGTPRIGPAPTGQSIFTELQTDSEEATPRAAPSRRPGRTARILADTQEDSLGPSTVQAEPPATAPKAAVAAGGWRVKKKAPAQETAPADVPATVQQGAAGASKVEEGPGAEVDFGAHVAKAVVHSPRQEYVPPAQQAQLQASGGGWKRKGISASQKPNLVSDPAPDLTPTSPPAAAVPSQEGAAPAPPPADVPSVPEQATPSKHDSSSHQAALPEQEAAPNLATAANQAVAPNHAPTPDQTPQRPLWQDLLSDVLPGTEEEVDNTIANTELRTAAETTPAEPDQAAGRAGSAKGSGGGAGPQPAPESQLPSAQKLSAALANVGELAACFPDTQAPQAAALPAMPGAAGLGAASGEARRGARRLPASVAEAASAPEEAAVPKEAAGKKAPKRGRKTAQKVFGRRGRGVSTAAAPMEAAGEAVPATEDGAAAPKASDKGKAPLTVSQTAAHTLAHVRIAHGGVPRVSPIPEDPKTAAGGKRPRGNAPELSPAAARAAKRGRAGTAEKTPAQEAATVPKIEPPRRPAARGKKRGASEGPAEAAPEREPEQAAPTDQKGGPAKRRKKGPAESQEASAAAMPVATGKPARGRKRAARPEPEQVTEAAADVADDPAPPLPAKRTRTPAAAAKGSQAEEAPAEASEAAAPKKGAAARKGRAAAAAAKEVEAAPPAAKRGGKKKSEAGVAAADAATQGNADAAKESEVAAPPVAKRGGRRSVAASQGTEAAAQAASQAEAPKTAVRRGRAATAAAAAESPTEEAAAEPPPAKRSRKSAQLQSTAAEEAEEMGLMAKQPAGKNAQKSSAGAKGPSQAEELAATDEAGGKKPAKGVRKSAAAAGEEGQPGQASKRGRKPAGTAAPAAASQAAEAGTVRQLRGADTKPPRVLISTCVDAKLRQAITRTVERLGGTVTWSSADFTVFVTLDASRGDKDRGFTKSLNALSALASGSPIVSEKWVDACARMDAFVSAKEFLLEDPAAEKKFGFSLAAAWEAAQQSLLLSGVHVFLTPGLLAAEADKGEGLRMLVARAAGNVAKTIPKKLPAADAAQWLLLGDEKSVAKEGAWAKKALSSKGFKLHGRSALISALMAQYLDRDADVLMET
ncbi:hypothetical protein WJX75_002264 [Coccomyxa subellipsoidea]|uniref:BRCT domain-containing protein n=1 Tax=Coccomyxa subellipsoidea TaxID=248742 RepID=A0ABR2YXC7_9CHLO